jgi:hypothetical protein
MDILAYISLSHSGLVWKPTSHATSGISYAVFSCAYSRNISTTETGSHLEARGQQRAGQPQLAAAVPALTIEGY